MADTVVSDALRFPQDEGLPNISDGSESWGSAGFLGQLATASAHGPFIKGLSFTGHDGGTDQVDVTSGHAWLSLNGETVGVQSALGGSSEPAHDTTLPDPGVIGVFLPTTVTNLGVTAATLNPVWVAYATDGAVTNVSAGDVYLRHGSGESEPPHPNLKIGETNPDDATADFLAGYHNAPDSQGWRLDPNAPFTGTASSSTLTFDLAGKYNEVLVDVTYTNMNTSANSLEMTLQVNGYTTADYKVTTYGLSELSGKSSWGTLSTITAVEKENYQEQQNFAMWITGDWASGGTQGNPKMAMMRSGINTSGGAIDAAMGGDIAADLTPPLQSITLIEANGNADWNHEVRVFGRHNSFPKS